MIPPREEIEHLYSPAENEMLDKIRLTVAEIAEENLRNDAGRRLVHALWPDEMQRIANTHWIATKDDGMQLLRPNYAQQRFHKDVIQRSRELGRPIRGIILKARQLRDEYFSPIMAIPAVR